MAWIPDVHPNELIASAWGNTVRDHVVNVFASAAERSAAIPAPTPGMVSFRTDGGYLEVYTAQSTPPGWYRPWRQPWGEVGYQLISHANAGGPVVITNSGYTLPQTGRRYRVTFRAIATGTQILTVTYTLYQGSNPANLGTVTLGGPNYRAVVVVADTLVNTGGSAGSGYVQMQADVGQVDTSYGRLFVDDVGAA